MPIFGWSREVGDLRPSHGVSLHAMQALPLLALVLRQSASGVRIMWGAAASYAILTVLVIVQAMVGYPLY